MLLAGEQRSASDDQSSEKGLNLPMWSGIFAGATFLVAACVGMAIFRYRS